MKRLKRQTLPICREISDDRSLLEARLHAVDTRAIRCHEQRRAARLKTFPNYKTRDSDLVPLRT